MILYNFILDISKYKIEKNWHCEYILYEINKKEYQN